MERRSAVAWMAFFHPEMLLESQSRKPAKILVTGDRNWTDDILIEKALSMWLCPGDTLIHGAARGADTLCALKAEAMGITTLAFPADWDTQGRAAGVLRNSLMLKENPLLVLAFHDNLEESKGTKDCVDKAIKLGLKVFVHCHGKDGSLRYYVL